MARVSVFLANVRALGDIKENSVRKSIVRILIARDMAFAPRMAFVFARRVGQVSCFDLD
jgi:hypothetical protein